MFQPIRGNDLPPDCANYLKGYLNSPISYLIHSTLKCYGEDYTITHISGVKCLHVVAAHPSAHMWTNMRDFLEDLAGFFFFCSEGTIRHSGVKSDGQNYPSTPPAGLITPFSSSSSSLLPHTAPATLSATLAPPSADIFTPACVGSRQGQPPVNSLD